MYKNLLQIPRKPEIKISKQILIKYKIFLFSRGFSCSNRFTVSDKKKSCIRNACKYHQFRHHYQSNIVIKTVKATCAELSEILLYPIYERTWDPGRKRKERVERRKSFDQVLSRRRFLIDRRWSMSPVSRCARSAARPAITISTSDRCGYTLIHWIPSEIALRDEKRQKYRCDCEKRRRGKPKGGREWEVLPTSIAVW